LVYLNINILDQTNQFIDGTSYKFANGNEEIQIGIDRNENIGNNITKTVGGNDNVNISGQYDKAVGSTYGLSVGSTTNIISGASINMDSPFININCGGYFGDDGSGLGASTGGFGTGLATSTAGGNNNSDHFPDGYNMFADYLIVNDVGVVLFSE